MHQGERLGGHPSMAPRLPPSLKPLMINARQANEESESRSQTLNLITAVFHKTLASAPSPRFSTSMGQLPSDFLAPTSPLPAADFAMSPRFTVTQVAPAFPSPAPSPRPGQTPHSVSSFEGEESSVTEDDKEADRTDEDQLRTIIRPNPPVRPPAPAPRRKEVCREAYQPMDEEEDDTGLSPTHTCVKLGARVCYHPKGQRGPTIMVDIVDYDVKKEQYKVRLPQGKAHWMTLSRERFDIHRAFKIHHSRMAMQHRVYKYAVTQASDTFVPSTTAVRHWAFKPVVIPDEPSPKKRGPQAKLGLASHGSSQFEPQASFNITMATSGSNGNARQSGRKRKTLAYDEDWVVTTAREEEDGEAAFGVNKRARGNGPNARGGQPGRRRRTKRLTMVNHRRRPTGSKAAGRRRVMEGVVPPPIVSSAEASRVPSEGEEEEEEEDMRMEGEYEQYDEEEEEEEEEQGPGKQQAPLQLECTEESAAFLQQAAEAEHRHLHQHYHLHHALQLSHLEPERTPPSVYSPLLKLRVVRPMEGKPVYVAMPFLPAQ